MADATGPTGDSSLDFTLLSCSHMWYRASPPRSAGYVGGGELGPGDRAEDEHVDAERQQPVAQVRPGDRGAQQRVEGQPPVRGQVRVYRPELRHVVGDFAGHGD